ncbi:MAG: RNA methyltransferase [Acidobacteriota bacterium]
MEEIHLITSRDNAKIKHAKGVRDGRDETQIFIEGVRLAEEALCSPLRCREAFVSEAMISGEKIDAIINALRNSGAIVYKINAKTADSLSDTKNGQGIVVLADRPRQPSLRELIPIEGVGIPTVIFLEKVNNPANLGAVIRTAEAAGAAGLIISEGSADPYSPKSLRASMGSAFRLPMMTGTELNEVQAWSKACGLISTAADISASNSHTRTDWGMPRLLVLGSEAHGLDAAVIDQMDELTSIEMDNGVESLNLAVASGIILFEAKRQNLDS